MPEAQNEAGPKPSQGGQKPDLDLTSLSLYLSLSLSLSLYCLYVFLLAIISKVGRLESPADIILF